jgi:hypothetical protein
MSQPSPFRRVKTSPEIIRLAVMRHARLIGKGTARDLRPTTDELNRLFRCFDDNERLTRPMTWIVKFAAPRPWPHRRSLKSTMHNAAPLLMLQGVDGLGSPAQDSSKWPVAQGRSQSMANRQKGQETVA